MRTNLHEDSDEITVSDLTNVRAAMYRERRKQFGTLPHSVLETVHVLRQLPMTTSKREDFLCTCEVVTEGAFVIFTTKSNLKTLCTAGVVLMDGTFSVCPKFFYQLYTFHAMINGHYIPLVHCLLPDKSTLTYTVMLQYIMRNCSAMQFTFNPSVIITDFEKSIHSAITAILPDSTLHCCRFHLGQSWWRFMNSNGIGPFYKDYKKELSRWLRLFFGLPLLPCGEVQEAFAEDIMADAPNSSSATLFADYVYENYISADAQFPPSMWAQPPDLFNTVPYTNNGAEAYHSHLNAEFYVKHPNIYIFVDVLKKIQSTTYVTLASLDQPARVSKHEKDKREFALCLYADYRSNAITRKEYIRKVAHRYGPRTDL